MIRFPIIKVPHTIKTGAYKSPTNIVKKDGFLHEVSYPVECTISNGSPENIIRGDIFFTRYINSRDESATSLNLEEFQMSWPFVEGNPINYFFLRFWAKDKNLIFQVHLNNDLEIENVLMSNSSSQDFHPISEYFSHPNLSEEELISTLEIISGCFNEIVIHHMATFPEVLEYWENNSNLN